MPIPDYGLKNERGEQILSRDPRFNHRWYSSRCLDIYDNDVIDDICPPLPARQGSDPFPNVFPSYNEALS